jgi:hypothetical protein
LLLLADRIEEAQRVAAEADEPDRDERREAHGGAARGGEALTRAGRRQQQERKHQPRGDLDANPCDQRGRGGAQARAGPRG